MSNDNEDVKTPQITNIDLIVKITTSWKQLNNFSKIALHSYISANELSTDEKMLHEIVRDLPSCSNVKYMETISDMVTKFLYQKFKTNEYREYHKLVDSHDDSNLVVSKNIPLERITIYNLDYII